MIEDELTKEQLKTEVIRRSDNACCICQVPFIHMHHIDLNNKNDVLDNIAPLCPNHHSLAHSKSNMYLNLTQKRIKEIRDWWYKYCENRREKINLNPLAKLKMKNFDRNFGLATYGWSKTFASLNPEFKNITKDEIIDRIFSTSNPDELQAYLETVKGMFRESLKEEKVKEEFRVVCNAFGFDYNGKKIFFQKKP